MGRGCYGWWIAHPVLDPVLRPVYDDRFVTVILCRWGGSGWDEPGWDRWNNPKNRWAILTEVTDDHGA